MSLNFPCPILSAAVTADESPSAMAVGLALSIGVLAVAIAWLTGLLRSDRLGANRRIPAGTPIVPLLGVTFAGLVVWMVVPTLFLDPAVQSGPSAGTMPATAPSGSSIVVNTSPRGLVLLNTIMPAVAFVILLCGDALVRPRVGQQLGFDLRHALPGVVRGLLGIAFAFAVVYCAMVLTEWFYQRINYEHPSEHDLLRIMGQTPDRFVKIFAIVAAVLVAPLWEELLFRGHIQTLLRETMIRIREGPSYGKVVVPLERRAGDVLEYDRPPIEAEPPASPPRAYPVESWAALVVSSALFASVHQPWTFPPIFVLSVCLGFAYERTGNLWVPIAMHSAFNTVMTALFSSRAGLS